MGFDHKQDNFYQKRQQKQQKSEKIGLKISNRYNKERKYNRKILGTNLGLNNRDKYCVHKEDRQGREANKR